MFSDKHPYIGRFTKAGDFPFVGIGLKHEQNRTNTYKLYFFTEKSWSEHTPWTISFGDAQELTLLMRSYAVTNQIEEKHFTRHEVYFFMLPGFIGKWVKKLSRHYE